MYLERIGGPEGIGYQQNRREIHSVWEKIVDRCNLQLARGKRDKGKDLNHDQ